MKKIIHGCNMEIKSLLHPMEGSALDAKVYEQLKQNMQRESLLLDEKHTLVSAIRSQPYIVNEDVTKTPISVECQNIEGPNGAFDIWIYQPENRPSDTPCMLYFHGGAYCGGSVKTVENFCKLIAEQAGIMVISVDYHLAPEYHFPCGIMDCYSVVNWAVEHANELEIDPKQIIVGGDSAGGTYAIDCCLLERERVQKGELADSRIKLQVLIYPAVLVDNHKTDDLCWKYSDYEVAKEDQMARLAIYELGAVMNELPEIYMGKQEKVTDPLAAPLHQESLKDLPKALVALSEFDFLRLSGEAFCRKLIRDGVPNEILLYKGMNHAFIDKIGYYDQAYDLASEIAKEIQKKDYHG